MPVSVVTMTITDTLGSLKFCTLTTSAAGMLRRPVPKPSTVCCAGSRPAEQPSGQRGQDGKQQRGGNRTRSENAQHGLEIERDDQDEHHEQSDARDLFEDGPQARGEGRGACLDEQPDDERKKQ